jgi:hypothetical protein
VAKEVDEKEKKAKRKKLRRKWKRLWNKLKLEKVENAKDKIQRRDSWQNFMKKKNILGELMKEKIRKYNSNASRRNEMLRICSGQRQIISELL